MDSQTKILFAAIIGVGLLVLGIFFQPAIEEKLAPEIKTAWVGIEVAQSGVAEVGPVEIEAGTPFSLHAVVEAEGRGGLVYYTEAPALSIAGREVAPERLRRWHRPLEARVRWFTVEGNPPYVELLTIGDLGRFRFQDLYRSDWPLAWSIPGLIDPARDDHLQDDAAVADRGFGTQRYHVSVELYDKLDKLRPKKQVRSWRSGDLEREIERFPTVRRVLPGRLEAASRVFGLTQLEVGGDSEPAVREELFREMDELARRGLAFSRATLLRDQLRSAGKRLEDLEWRDVDLVAGQSRWEDAAGPGDLLRVGERLVVLYEDRGTPDRLDYDDLCFDFVHGAKVRRLGGVFSGDGVVELASLSD